MSQAGSDDEEDELEDDGKEVLSDVQPMQARPYACIACLVAANAQGCWRAGLKLFTYRANDVHTEQNHLQTV